MERDLGYLNAHSVEFQRVHRIPYMVLKALRELKRLFQVSIVVSYFVKEQGIVLQIIKKDVNKDLCGSM